MPAGAAMETKTVAMNDLTAKSSDKAGSSVRDFRRSISDVVCQHLVQSGQFKTELNQQLKQSLSSVAMNFESKVLVMKMQHDEAMAEEKRRSEELAKLLKNAMEEKESWEKAARQLSALVTAMDHALKQGLQNYTTCLSSTDNEDAIVGEEVASNFCRKSRDEDGEDEPAAKRRRLRDLNK